MQMYSQIQELPPFIEILSQMYYDQEDNFIAKKIVLARLCLQVDLGSQYLYRLFAFSPVLQLGYHVLACTE